MKIYLSPSTQDDNLLADGLGNEQQFAIKISESAAKILQDHGHTVKIHSDFRGNDSYGYINATRESNAWQPDLHVAVHSNATGVPGLLRSGVQAYCFMSDPKSVSLGKKINARVGKIIPGGTSIMDGGGLLEVNGTNATAVLMELGYHDNPEQARILANRNNDIGVALAYGILDYIGTPIKNEQSLTNERNGIVASIDELMNYPITRQGMPGNTSLYSILAHLDHNLGRIINGQNALAETLEDVVVESVREALENTDSKTKITTEKVIAILEDAFAKVKINIDVAEDENPND